MVAVPKRKRIKDPDLLRFIKEKIPCLICCSPAEGHHLSSRKSGGNDEASNCLPICRRHHTEIHQIGNAKFAKKYPVFMTWLELAGRLDLIQKIKASPLWDREDSHAQRSS